MVFMDFGISGGEKIMKIDEKPIRGIGGIGGIGRIGGIGGIGGVAGRPQGFSGNTTLDPRGPKRSTSVIDPVARCLIFEVRGLP